MLWFHTSLFPLCYLQVLTYKASLSQNGCCTFRYHISIQGMKKMKQQARTNLALISEKPHFSESAPPQDTFTYSSVANESQTYPVSKKAWNLRSQLSYIYETGRPGRRRRWKQTLSYPVNSVSHNGENLQAFQSYLNANYYYILTNFLNLSSF